MIQQSFRLLSSNLLLALLLNAVACGTSPPASPTPTAAAAVTTAPTPAAPTPTAPAAATTASTPAPTPLALATATVAPTANPQPTSTEFNFDKDAVGALPQGAVTFSGVWAVRAEGDAPSPPNALCQTGTATFPALSLTSVAYADVVVVTRFKPIAGREDQAAGIIFRIQDKDNYYILRANALENNANIYKYVAGRRSILKEGTAKVASGKWQELRMEVMGNRIRGLLDGQLVVEASDDTYQTGGVGLWTKADSVTCFDEVKITAKPPQR